MTSREELLQRARDLVPVLRERAASTEVLRRPPPETIHDFCVTELLRVPQPERFGGLGLDYHVMLEVTAELGRGCGSAAWCYAIWASHNWVVGMYPEQAQQEYWADGVDTLSCTSFSTSRTEVTAAPGGYRVTGRWSFSSGCDASSWGLLTGLGPDGPLVFLIPQSDFVIDDTWFVSGLRGTGSKDVVVEDILVPDHRVLPLRDMQEARTPGRALHDTASYRIPLYSLFSFTLASPILGMAQGAIEAFESLTRDRVSTQGETLIENTAMQIRLAEATAEVQAARLTMRHSCDQVYARARCHEMPTLEERAGYRRDQTYVAKLSVQAINRIFEASGGHALYDSSPIQRFHRDAHAASHHAGLSWDAAAEQYGRVRFGLPLVTRRL